MSRVAGIALLAFGLACWPDRDAAPARAPLRAMLVYNWIATLYLLHLGIKGEWIGRLLWAAVVAHATLGLACAGAAMRTRAPEGASP